MSDQVDVLAVMDAAAAEAICRAKGARPSAELVESQRATIMKARAAVAELINGLKQAVAAIEHGGLDDLMCCDGRDCGCRAATNGDRLVHDLRAALARVTGSAA